VENEPPAFADGAAGLVSSADDLLAFARMLMAGGIAPGGARVLPAAAVSPSEYALATPPVE
jgi:CubicO group peptidase (beta-lactamase class C family)